ncbi:unnamed protein product [marine sediment metagenome]|uniref:Uncharacterized protein n=1 Tax=marine sediment metagenome TaxID=412755 RepID=X1LBN5_9ZZZZ
MEQRDLICKDYESRGLRLLHDTFDSDWQRGDEPHGTLTFTDEPSLAPYEPPEPPPVFTPENLALGIEQRVSHIEAFLQALHPPEK